MNKRHLSWLPALALLLLSSCQAKPSSSPASSSYETTRKGYVHAEGKELVDGEGNKMLLRGTNLGGLFIHERWMSLTDSPDMLSTINALTARFDREAAFDLLDTYQQNFLTLEDLDALAALGINCLRMPISYMDVYDCDFDLLRSDDPKPEDVAKMKLTLRKDHLRFMDRLIEEADRRGMYVILDLHGAYGSQNGNDHSIDARQHDWLWREDDLGAVFRDLTLDLWTVLAEHYKDQKNIAGYDLLNEPAGDANDPECVTSVTGQMQWDYFDALYDAIRPIDPNHLIIMESCWGAANLPAPSLYGWENVMYEFHHYDGATSDEAQLQTHRYRISEIVNARFGVPLYLGEFCPHCSYEGWGAILDLLNKNHVSWTTWNFRVRGFSEWGLWHIRVSHDEDPSLPISEIPGILRGNDSYAEIERKWGKDLRKGFAKNEALCEQISLAAKAAIDFE